MDSNLEKLKDYVNIGPDGVSNTKEYLHPEAFNDERSGFDMKEYVSNVEMKFLSKHEEANDFEEVQFQISGISNLIANPIRRIMLAELPTMAFEEVFFYQNTSLLHDEVLAHRIGMIPLKADPKKFKYPPNEVLEGKHIKIKNTQGDENSTLVYKLHCECKGDAPMTVHAKDIEWVPCGNQSKKFKAEAVLPIHPNIVIARLAPGQKIEAEIWARKGTGRHHIKWSPVATAFYRLAPEIRFKHKVIKKEAEKLVKLCPRNVFDIEDIDGIPTAIVKDVLNCNSCRECVIEPEERAYLAGTPKTKEDYLKKNKNKVVKNKVTRAKSIELLKKRNTFIFTVESHPMYFSEDIFLESLNVLRGKCTALLEELK